MPGREGMNGEDLRVVKTRRNIEETFVRLLTRVPFDQMTVRLIVSEAQVNKGTFYRHYQDKYDLAERAFERLSDEVRAGVRERVAGLAQGAPLADLMRSLSLSQADVMPKVMAFRGVPLQEGSMESRMEALFAEEFSRAVEEWGASLPPDEDIPGWAVSNLAMGFLRHCWQSGEQQDPRAYLEAVHRVTKIYLDQVDRDAPDARNI
ncbi:MAG: TetR/AcrR family transcriptional regulator [Coriobacteriales bacterium]|jgi:AcrR family transcriptional regulator